MWLFTGGYHFFGHVAYSKIIHFGPTVDGSRWDFPMETITWIVLDGIVYPPAIKHGVPENGPKKSVIFLASNLHLVRGLAGFSNIFQPCD